MANEQRWDRFWDVLCDFYEYLWAGFGLTVVMLALSVGSYFIVDRTTGSFIIVQWNIVMLTGLLIAITFFLRRCSERNW
jgi:hypothetical protein